MHVGFLLWSSHGLLTEDALGRSTVPISSCHAHDALAHQRTALYLSLPMLYVRYSATVISYRLLLKDLCGTCAFPRDIGASMSLVMVPQRVVSAEAPDRGDRQNLRVKALLTLFHSQAKSSCQRGCAPVSWAQIPGRFPKPMRWRHRFPFEVFETVFGAHEAQPPLPLQSQTHTGARVPPTAPHPISGPLTPREYGEVRRRPLEPLLPT